MPTSVELFAGAGGLGMGLSLAGFEHLAVIERDRWACDTVRENQQRRHPLVSNWPLHQRDVRQFAYSDIGRPVDVVAGGPPCQPFSICGKHAASLDARDMFPTTVNVIRQLRPRAFLIENVKGLLRDTFSDYFTYILLQLEFPEAELREGEDWATHQARLQRHKTSGSRSGLTYNVTYRLVEAADYGVPQRRQRVFIVGFRNDLGVRWTLPPATHSSEMLTQSKWVSGEYWDRHGVALHERGPRPDVARRPSAVLRQDTFSQLQAWRTVRDALQGLPDPVSDAAKAETFLDHRFQPGVKFYAGHTGSPIDLPAKTLKAGDHGVPGGENALVGLDGGRYFTVREAARLQTFPDDYKLHGCWSECMRQLGNAVPVKLARVVAVSIASELQRSASVRPTEQAKAA